MTTLTITILATHILAGVVGLIANYTTLLSLLKRFVTRNILIGSSVLAAVSHMLSWGAGWHFYTQNIPSGAGSLSTTAILWAPYMATALVVLTLALTMLLWTSPITEETPDLKKKFILASSIATLLATAVTLVNVVVMGAL